MVPSGDGIAAAHKHQGVAPMNIFLGSKTDEAALKWRHMDGSNVNLIKDLTRMFSNLPTTCRMRGAM